MRITKKKIVGVVAATAVVALGSTAAFAYWTASGDATGHASTGHPDAISVSFDFGSTLLGPGGTVTVASATSTNTNAYPVSITSLNSILLSDFHGGCNPADFHVLIDGVDTSVIPFPVALSPISVPSGTNVPFSLAGHVVSIHMDNTSANQDACQDDNLLLTAHFA
jgi:hypothetical protein